MASAAAVKEVLIKGQEQEVEGVLIRVQRFERQPEDEDEEEQEEEQPEAREAQEDGLAAAVLAKSDFDRQQSCFSTVSTKSDFDRQQSCFSTVSTRTASSFVGSFESDSSAVCGLGAGQD